MKKSILISLAVITFLWMGCGQQADVNSMLKNAETKDKVFAAIVEDHELMTEFMTKMMANGNMMNMMKDNPDMMHNMMSGMMKDGNMMGHMMQMMNQEGMMSDECMQSCTKMMKDKGMSMDMMGDKGGSTEKEGDKHDSHH
jgi:hypothetical protein